MLYPKNDEITVVLKAKEPDLSGIRLLSFRAAVAFSRRFTSIRLVVTTTGFDIEMEIARVTSGREPVLGM